MTGFNTM